MSSRWRFITLAALVTLVACGGPVDPDAAAPTPDADDGTVEWEESLDREESPQDSSADAQEGGPWEDFDHDAEREDAKALLGLAEDDLEESPKTRIVRRGEEQFSVTLDLRPGRQNVELDDDGSGTYVVTRVTVEVPDDDDPLIVE